jgi:UPF0176 protein
MTAGTAIAPAAPPAHNAPWDVVALYAFTPIEDREALQAVIKTLGLAHGLCGTLLIADEGFNGTLAGPKAGLEALVAVLQARLAPGRQAEIKYSHASSKPFARFKVRLKKEIVTMGVDGVDPSREVGTYLDARQWNALLDDPDTIVIDTRNDYETAIGVFDKAVDPGTRSFRAFPDWARANRAMLEGKKLAMYCTGGIRCEKATAFMKAEGFGEVYHLKGGILKYLEDTPAADSKWKGECFVFDERVAIAHGLAEGDAIMCRACGYPLVAEDVSSPLYVENESCPHCAGEGHSPNRRGKAADAVR